MVVYRLYTIVYRAWPGGSGENSPIWGCQAPITYLCIYYLLFILLLFYFLFNGLEKSIKRIMTNKIREKIKFFTLQ